MHVLVPIDDSDPAREAFERAITTAPDAAITALHVVEPSVAAYRSDDGPYGVQLPVTAEADHLEAVFDPVRALASEHDVSLTTEVLVGSPARSIVDVATEADVDRIVIGSHGRTGVSRVLLGSVAERVVRRAPVPVTVVR
ncbi:universal stress protein [Natronobacterium gregoryi]|uniref:Universal stress protein n=2 Tax=Natronobacterium gregoryi TaxID=44930 RepID=L0AFW0_NATGS|nr:universal stress protein [Natronobacterium gregoryi]AFZ71945.1 universal stress protein UspA-like protein [Natronobacterium gregoryi SP2]ELY62560.1 UspA domain-containing protein [Natronobacterium gregoryi SP2]PLK20722.1 universal stress protein [Natronobacterium gregoryi SP2]SFJ13165.1 Nucleotide-binding universal stress protein, UspA family [Natronobacterium gregoryi]